MSKTIMMVALIPLEARSMKLVSFVLDQYGQQLSPPDLVDLKVSVNLGKLPPALPSRTSTPQLHSVSSQPRLPSKAKHLGTACLARR